ncbi:MAG: hypothetical protein ACOVJ5_01625 [Gloeomargaritales cyanobacterium]
MKDLTAKEKAKELYSKYYNRIEHTLSEEYSPNEIDVVKQCALIAVDEILKSIIWHHDFSNQTRNYWQEVKSILEKL